MIETFHIQWHITNQCNFRCAHCYQDDFSKGQNLPFDSLKKIAENIFSFLEAENRKLTVNLTGGEPLLHPDWKKLISFLLDSDYVAQLGIITNGFFLNEKTLKELAEFPGTEINLSTEGFDRESYEFYRGSGTYSMFLKNLNLLTETDFEKTLMFTLLETNARQMEKLLDFAEQYRFENVIIERFIPWGKGKEIKDQVVSFDTWLRTVRLLLQMCNLDDDLALVLPYRAFRLSRSDTGFQLSGAPCVVGKDGCAVMPDGTLFPCRRFPLKLGNLLTESLTAIWKDSPVLNTVRNRGCLKGRCQACEIEDCSGCRALAYALTGDFLAEDPLCFISHTVSVSDAS